MKDDKILMPLFSLTVNIHVDPEDYDICQLFDCEDIDCKICAINTKYNFKKWQEQCKDK